MAILIGCFLQIHGKSIGSGSSSDQPSPSEPSALLSHEQYDPKYDIRVSMEVRGIMTTPIPSGIAAKEQEEDEFCDVVDESEDSSDSPDTAGDGDGNEYEEEGCDLSDHNGDDDDEADDPGSSKALNGTVIIKVKDRRESNDVESKTKKRDLSYQKEAITAFKAW